MVQRESEEVQRECEEEWIVVQIGDSIWCAAISGVLQVSEIDFEQSRKADRQLVFDEVDGVTNMRSMARWVRAQCLTHSLHLLRCRSC